MNAIICIIFCAVLWFFGLYAGFHKGYDAAYKSFQSDAIKHHAAHYNPASGEFNWNDTQQPN